MATLKDLETFLNDRLKSKSKSKSTVSQYKYCINLLKENNIDKLVVDDILKLFDNKLVNPNTYITRLSPLITFFKHKNYSIEFNKLINKRNQLENKIDSTIDNDIVEDWDEIYNKAKTIQDFDEKLLIYCFLFIPLRSDITTVKIRNYNAQVDNYYLNGKIVFNSLIKKGGIKTIDVPKELDDLIQNIKLVNYQEDYLIRLNYKDRSNGITRQLGKVSLKYFGKQLTINDYRHIYSTHKAKQTEDLPLKARLKSIDETSKLMNNSVLSQVRYYIRKTMDNKREDFEKSLNNINAIHSYDGKVYIVENIIEVIDMNKFSL